VTGSPEQRENDVTAAAGARMMMMMMMDQSAYMLALFTGPGEAGSARRKMSPAAVVHLRQSDRRRSRPV